MITQARKVHDFLTVGAAAPLQEAAVAGLEMPASYYESLRDLYARKRKLFLEGLGRSGFAFTEPQGAYYVMVDVSPLGFVRDRDAAEWLAREIGVAGVPGSSFFARRKIVTCGSILRRANRRWMPPQAALARS